MSSAVIALAILSPVFAVGTAVFIAYLVKEFLMGAVQDAVDAVVAQINKAQAEILAQIAALEAREPSVDLTALKAAAQALDDINPDVVEEPPVEPPTEV